VTVSGDFVSVGEHRQPGGKLVVAWAVEAREPVDVSSIVSNTFTLEWPPKSGKFVEFREVDRAARFDGLVAAEKVLEGQLPLVRAAFAKVTAR
jgi:predicted NUDIX family NTP pyrophosphohydrolase